MTYVCCSTAACHHLSELMGKSELPSKDMEGLLVATIMKAYKLAVICSVYICPHYYYTYIYYINKYIYIYILYTDTSMLADQQHDRSWCILVSWLNMMRVAASL